MRIISGKYKGRIITPPRNLRARPTTDFAKENLFNVLAGMVDVEECDVLDLFAGTGSVSYEFASRGARSVTAVEINAVHHDFIRRTATTLGFEHFYPVKANVFNYLRACTRQFDIIFSDAPYDLVGSEEVIRLVFERGLLRPKSPVPEGSTSDNRVRNNVSTSEKWTACDRSMDEDDPTSDGGKACSGNDYEGSADEEADDRGGLLIFEHSKDQNFSSHPNFLQSRNYGSVQFSMFGIRE